MARYIDDGCVDGVEKVKIIPEEGSSIEIEKPLLICKKCRGSITENNAKMASCKSFPYLVHTHCECGNGNKCLLCGNPAHFVSVKLSHVQMPTETKQSKLRKFLKMQTAEAGR
ncbi:PREDICTED: uncharacterized protein LOC109179008 isoform X3 [Ipomoea nil]|uniref:uncharacterized protein LOC109179008 isoform X3 n=1 Tax=Ipomoea nil TaxID=35883 RepID=UPI0009009923|nr:PREDICTED: uncharacterized protein LOC109179008 isoform X3 [Ipomoea nil]